MCLIPALPWRVNILMKELAKWTLVMCGNERPEGLWALIKAGHSL